MHRAFMIGKCRVAFGTKKLQKLLPWAFHLQSLWSISLYHLFFLAGIRSSNQLQVSMMWKSDYRNHVGMIPLIHLSFVFFYSLIWGGMEYYFTMFHQPLICRKKNSYAAIHPDSPDSRYTFLRFIAPLTQQGPGNATCFGYAMIPMLLETSLPHVMWLKEKRLVFWMIWGLEKRESLHFTAPGNINIAPKKWWLEE